MSLVETSYKKTEKRVSGGEHVDKYFLNNILKI